MTEQTDLLTLARAREDDLIDFARRLIMTPSMPGEEGAIAALVRDEMQRLRYDEVHIDEMGNVIGLLRGQGQGRSVMLNTHLDHVSAGDLTLWMDDPFSATVRDGQIYGRGAVDIKGPMACQVYAGALLREHGLLPAGDLYVVGAVYEECGGIGSRYLAQTTRTDCAVIGEPSSNTLRRGHRGRVGMIARVHGRAGHASVPAQALNPHYPLATFIGRLQQLQFRQQEPFGSSSVAPTLYSTDNTSSNVIPSSATLYLDWRNVPAETPDEVVQGLKALLAESLTPGFTGSVEVESEVLSTYTGRHETLPAIFPGFALEENDPHVITARQALENLLRRTFEPGIWRFATDGGNLMAAGIPTIGFGPGDEHQAHVANEHIAIAEMVEALAANAALARALSAMPRA